MNIQTKFFGEIDIQNEIIWSFPKGIPGFEEEKEFVLLPISDNPIFNVLQSVNVRDIALIVANPHNLIEDYSYDIDEPTIKLLDIKKVEEFFVLSVLSIKEPFETSTINLQAPIIFNSRIKRAKQMIINDNKFALRHIIGSLLINNSEEE